MYLLAQGLQTLQVWGHSLSMLALSDEHFPSLAHFLHSNCLSIQPSEERNKSERCVAFFKKTKLNLGKKFVFVFVVSSKVIPRKRMLFFQKILSFRQPGIKEVALNFVAHNPLRIHNNLQPTLQ